MKPYTSKGMSSQLSRKVENKTKASRPRKKDPEIINI
jgi:hypothetical protein